MLIDPKNKNDSRIIVQIVLMGKGLEELKWLKLRPPWSPNLKSGCQKSAINFGSTLNSESQRPTKSPVFGILGESLSFSNSIPF